MRGPILLACAILAPAIATAAPCAPREAVIGQIAKTYAESRVALGLTNGGVVEVLTSPQTGSWAIVITRPDGTTCAVMAGEAWTVEAQQPPGRDG